MSTRELAISMIDKLTEEELEALVVILSGLHRDEPNELTKQVISEAEHGINMSNTFDSIEEFWEDVNA